MAATIQQSSVANGVATLTIKSITVNQASVPEPSTFALLLVGVSGLVSARRKMARRGFAMK